MVITLCGSIQFHQKMREVARELKKLGFTVQVPKSILLMETEGYIQPEGFQEKIEAKIRNDFIRDHFRKIEKSDAIVVLNYDKNGIKGYVGGNTLMEMGLAYWLGKSIYLLYATPEISYKDEIAAMQPTVINGNLRAIVS